MHTDPVYLSATGHRLKYLQFDPYPEKHLALLAEKALRRIAPDRVMSGMALGWDTAVAGAALKLGLPLYCIIPFANQPAQWKPEEISRWYGIKMRAAGVITISKSPRYSLAAMQVRNQYLVNNCNWLLALYNGSDEGGTAHCMSYAKTKLKERDFTIENLWEEYKELVNADNSR